MNIFRESKRPWLMLVIRSLLFLAFQALLALFYLSSGSASPWHNSAAWWPMVVILTNLACLALLNRFYREQPAGW